MIKLFLHVGTHKTGTTSLQAYLVDHKDDLRRQGVHVLTEKYKKFGEIGNCLGFVHAVLRPSLMTAARMTGDMARRRGLKRYMHRQRVRRWLAGLPKGASAIISAEAFCFARTDEENRLLRNIFTGLDIEVVPVVCFRKESDWRKSWENELQVWSDRMTHGFGDGMNDISGDWYFDTGDIIRFWEKFGPITKVNFDAACAENGSVLPSLLDAIGIPQANETGDYFLRKSQ